MSRLSLTLTLFVLASPVIAADAIMASTQNCPVAKEVGTDREDDDREHKAVADKEKTEARSETGGTPALRSRPGWRGFLPGMMR